MAQAACYDASIFVLCEQKQINLDVNVQKMIFDDSGSTKQRSCTDRLHLLAFLMFFALWVSVGIFAYSSSVAFFNVVSPFVYENYVETVESALYKGRFVCLGFICLSILFLGLYFYVIDHLPRCTIYFTCFLTCALMCILIVLSLTLFPIPQFFVTFFVVIFFINEMTMFALKRVGTDVVCKIIKDSLRAMLHFPSSILIVAIQIALSLFIAFCSISIVFYLYTPYNTREQLEKHSQSVIPVYRFILVFINSIYTIWMIIFVSHVARALLHGSFVIWCQIEDKKDFSRALVLRQMKSTLRYHLGTLALGSTFFTKVQVLRGIFSGKVRLGNVCETFGKLARFIVILGHVTVNALIISVVFGKNSYESTKDSINLLMRNQSKFVAARGVTRWMVGFGLFIIPALSTTFAFFHVSNERWEPAVFRPLLHLIGYVNLIITATLIFVFDAAIEAVLFSYLCDESLKQKKDKSDDPTASNDQYI